MYLQPFPNTSLRFFRIREKLKSGEIMVAGDQWPRFLYEGYIYDQQDPWDGLLRSQILVYVSHISFAWNLSDKHIKNQAFEHIFTSPSSVDHEPKATHSGNARIHGMTHVTPGSIAYVATQVSISLTFLVVLTSLRHRSVLLSALHQCLHVPTRSQTQKGSTTASSNYWMMPRKYKRWTHFWLGGISEQICYLASVLLTHLSFSQVFPSYLMKRIPTSTETALAKIRARRAALRQTSA